MKDKKQADWILRFIKGMFIGSGFILPGISGGALAAVFGIYERMIAFLANLRKDFKENVLFFIPVGLGAVAGIFVLSFAVSYLLGTAETYVLWFFIGCIVGTLPALWKQAGKQGRKPGHLILMAVSCVAAYIFLRVSQSSVTASLSMNFLTWLLAGAIIGLGAVVPGLSPSNLLVYLNLYKAMTDGIKGMDFGVIIPLVLGAAGCVLALSKVMNYLFGKAYAGLYHFILGVVLASTFIIVPLDFNYLSAGALICLIALFVGAALGLWMSRLEDEYKLER